MAEDLGRGFAAWSSEHMDFVFNSKHDFSFHYHEHAEDNCCIVT